MDYTELNSFILTHHRLVHRITVWTSWRFLNMDAIIKMLSIADEFIYFKKDFLNDNEYLWELYQDILENKTKYNDKQYIKNKIDELNKKHGNI